MIAKNASYLDLDPCCIQLTRSDNINHLDLVAAKESRTESTFCAILGKTFGNETVLTTLLMLLSRP